tara:strand:+ start:21071 stop:21295 length:225 start_codon:yes stop_codon:yes gene_type:complete
MKSTKKTGQLSTHVTDEVERQIKALAHFAGMSSSEYMAEVLTDHLREKRRVYEDMREVFGSLGSIGSIGTRGAE